MATKKPMKKPVKRVRRFQEGGEAALKAEGLAASNKDAPLGFFDSLRRLGQGNIDQEGSEAYNRYGAGRGRMERDRKSQAEQDRMVDAMNASNKTMNARTAPAAEQSQNYAQIEEDEDARRGLAMRAAADGVKDYKKYTGPIAKQAAVAENAAILAKKRPAARPSVKFNAAKDSQAANVAPATPATTKPAAAAASGSVEVSPNFQPIPGQSPAPASVADGERLPEVTGMSNLEKLIAGTGIAGGALGIATKGKKIYQAGKKAFQNFRSAKDAVKKSPPSGATGVMPSKYIYTGAKKGGMVKKMAHGGSVKSTVSSASKRGDGIALRGKTRGKIY